MNRIIFVVILTLCYTHRSWANDLQSMKTLAGQINASCHDGPCFSARSYDHDMPDDFGQLLRSSCVLHPNEQVAADNRVDCWRASMEYLTSYEASSQSLDSLSQFKIGLVIHSCGGISEGVKGDRELEARRRGLCFYQAANILRKPENTWRRSPYVELAYQACTLNLKNAEAKINERDTLLNSDPRAYIKTPMCSAGAITSLLNNATLPSTEDEISRLKLEMLNSGCPQYPSRNFPNNSMRPLDYSGICFDQGLSTMSLPDMEAEILRAGSSFDGARFSQGVSYLLNYRRPIDEHGRIKYSAGLILSMCRHDVNHPWYDDHNYGKESNECARNSITTLIASSSPDGVQVREQNIQPAIRPLIEVGVECNGDVESDCYYRTLTTIYNSY